MRKQNEAAAENAAPEIIMKAIMKRPTLWYARGICTIELHHQKAIETVYDKQLFREKKTV